MNDNAPCYKMKQTITHTTVLHAEHLTLEAHAQFAIHSNNQLSWHAFNQLCNITFLLSHH